MTAKKFRYKAIDSAGKTIEGIIEAISKDEVGNWLAERHYIILEISDVPLSIIETFIKNRPLKVSTKEMNYFLLQLSGLLNAGCPLLMSLQALSNQLPECNLKKVITDLKEKIEIGKSFSEALRYHPQVFSSLFIAMVEVGEIAGILDKVLEKYANLYDTLYQVRNRVISSLIYPFILLILSIIVSWALLVWVFPNFISMFLESGHPLPLPTQIVLGLSNFIVNNKFIILLTSISVFVALVVIANSKAGKYYLSSILLKIPGIRNIFKHIELSLFSKTLGTLLNCGVPILTSLAAVEKALNNYIYKEALKDIKQNVERGISLSSSMSVYRNLFPDSLILMVDVGERSGELGKMLDKAGIIYERELSNTIETFTSLLQPFLVIFMSIFIVTLALAMYMPLFDLLKVMR